MCTNAYGGQSWMSKGHMGQIMEVREGGKGVRAQECVSMYVMYPHVCCAMHKYVSRYACVMHAHECVCSVCR